MPYSINTVRFTERFVVFNQIALRISAIESVDKFYDQAWNLQIRMKSGDAYTFVFQNSVDNYFDRLTS
jgi:hypothetical protein